MDKLVIDIETSNTFAEVGGDRNLAALNVSLIGCYSYNRDEYFSFTEHTLAQFGPLLQRAGLLIGFAINRFDLPVLAKHYSFNLMSLNRLDLLEEVELATGHRISLNSLAKANLGLEKTHANGLEATRLYKEGKMDELRDYCLNDVKLTKELYDLAKSRGYFIIPPRDGIGEAKKVELEINEPLLAATLF